MPALLLQADTSAAAEHLLFQSERVYAVMGVMLLVFGLLVVFLIRQERKTTALEKEIQGLRMDNPQEPKA